MEKNLGPSDTLEPVGTVVNQATPDRQHATGNNGETPFSGGPQAGESHCATGSNSVHEGIDPFKRRDKEENPFTRRGSVARSPPVLRRGSNGSQSSRESEQSKPDFKGQLLQPPKALSVKRPREEETDRELKELKDIMAELSKTSVDLVQCINVNINTKTEIKSGVKKVSRLVDCLNRRIEGWEDLPQKAKAKVEPKKTTTVATQVNWEEVKKEREKIKNENREEIVTALKSPGDFNTLTTVIEKKWPEDIYKATEKEVGDLQTLRLGEDVAIFLDPELKSNKDKNMEKILNRFPLINSILEEGLVEGQIETVKVQTEITSKKGTKGESYTIHALPTKIDGSGIIEVETLYGNCKNLADTAARLEKKSINVILPDTMEVDYVRKCLEHTFRNSGIKAKITTSDSVKTNGRKKSHFEGNEKGRAADQIIIKAQGLSYAELLKNVKEKVDIDKEGIDVKKIKKTNKGDLLLEVRGKDSASKLQQSIKSTMGNAELIHKTRETVLHIFDIDADITEEQLKTDIRKNIRATDDNLQVISLRSTKWGSQVAIIKLKKEPAEALIKKGEIKIGWVKCKIKKKLHLTRCFKCLEYGHRKNECKGLDRANVCINCAKEGHVAKDCKNSPHCTKCRIDGHRADKMKCPYLKKLVKEEEKKHASRNSTYRTRGDYSDEVFMENPLLINKN